MASIAAYLQRILSAVYGEEVRGSIHDAVNAINKESSEAMELARQYSSNPPKPQNGTWWIWDTDKQSYYDSKISCDLTGPKGIGIQDILLYSGNHLPGTTDIYSVNTTDGNSYFISVYNGRNGTGSGDVLGTSFDLAIPVSTWSNGENVVSDERLIAQESFKYFLSANTESLKEFTRCNVFANNIFETGTIKFTSDITPETDLTVNIVRIELGANAT
jgi:hypothetical protein